MFWGGAFVIGYLKHYVLYGYDSMEVREMSCSCYFIVVRELNFKLLDYQSTFLGVF